MVEEELSGHAEANGSIFASVASDVLEQEEKRYLLEEQDHDFLLSVLQTCFDLSDLNFDTGSPAGREEARSVIGRDEFETAFVLLQIRARENAALEENVVAWAQLTDEFLKDDSFFGEEMN